MTYEIAIALAAGVLLMGLMGIGAARMVASRNGPRASLTQKDIARRYPWKITAWSSNQGFWSADVYAADQDRDPPKAGEFWLGDDGHMYRIVETDHHGTGGSLVPVVVFSRTQTGASGTVASVHWFMGEVSPGIPRFRRAHNVRFPKPQGA